MPGAGGVALTGVPGAGVGANAAVVAVGALAASEVAEGASGDWVRSTTELSSLEVELIGAPRTLSTRQ